MMAGRSRRTIRADMITAWRGRALLDMDAAVLVRQLLRDADDEEVAAARHKLPRGRMASVIFPPARTPSNGGVDHE